MHTCVLEHICALWYAQESEYTHKCRLLVSGCSWMQSYTDTPPFPALRSQQDLSRSQIWGCHYPALKNSKRPSTFLAGKGNPNPLWKLKRSFMIQIQPTSWCGLLAYFFPLPFCAFTVIVMTDIFELSLCTRCYFKHLTCIKSFAHPNNTMR